MKTLQQIRTLLGDIEPTDKTFAPIDKDDIPHLQTLLGDEEDWLAARAVHALSRINEPSAHALLQHAAADSRDSVRVAVASSLGRVAANTREELLEKLLDDKDIGVRKFTLHQVPAGAPERIRNKVQKLAQVEENEQIRALASRVHARLR